jgi:hypothetical protein
LSCESYVAEDENTYLELINLLKNLSISLFLIVFNFPSSTALTSGKNLRNNILYYIFLANSSTIFLIISLLIFAFLDNL